MVAVKHEKRFILLGLFYATDVFIDLHKSGVSWNCVFSPGEKRSAAFVVVLRWYLSLRCRYRKTV